MRLQLYFFLVHRLVLQKEISIWGFGDQGVRAPREDCTGCEREGGIRSPLPVCVDADVQQGQGDLHPGAAPRGPQRKQPLGGGARRPWTCLSDFGGWGWGRLQGLGAGVGPLSVQTRCEEGLSCQGGREGEVKTRHTPSHPHKPGEEPSVVWKRVHVVLSGFNILENHSPVLLGAEGCGTTKVVDG